MKFLKLITLPILLLMSTRIQAQFTDTFKLKEAIDYGLIHNINIQKSKLDLEKSKYKKNEAMAGYLPQVKGSASVIDNLKLQTSILPGEAFGQPGQTVAVKFGTKYNVTAGIDVSQTIFDASQLMSLKAASESESLALLNQQKTKEQMIYDIASAYYAAQITSIQKEISENNLSKIDSLITITKVKYDNGFAKKLDYDRLIINRTNAKTELDNININYSNQLLYLKYTMSMPIDTDIVLAKSEYQNVNGVQYELSIQGNTDIKLLQNQTRLQSINLKQTRAGYLPTLTFGYRYAYQVQQNQFDLFSSNTNWFPNSYFSFNLNVPIFDGGSKHSKSQQIKMDMEQIKLNEQNLQQSLVYQSAKSNNKLLQNRSLLAVQQNNIRLAEEVYAASQSQLQGGLGSMSDLINAETALKEAQINYLNALVQIKVAELDILKTTGNLNALND